MKKVHYKKYDLIFTEGDPGNSAYMIDEGKIAIISGKGMHGKHKVLAILNKDSIFGEMFELQQPMFLRIASYPSSPQRHFII